MGDVFDDDTEDQGDLFFGTQPPVEPQGGESQEAAPAQVRPTREEYEGQGGVLVKTRRGHAVTPTDKSLPVVDEHGVEMSPDQAVALHEEYPEWVVSAEPVQKQEG